MVIVMPFKLGGYKICNFSPGTFRFWPLNASRLRLNFTINQPNPGLIPTLHLKTFEILVPPNPFRFQKFLILYCNGIGLVIYRIALVMVNRISSQVDTMRTNVTKFFPNVTKSVRKISWHYALLVWWNSHHWEASTVLFDQWISRLWGRFNFIEKNLRKEMLMTYLMPRVMWTKFSITKWPVFQKMLDS